MNATIIIPAASRTRAKETFGTGEYLFNVGLSATGQVPFTHYVSSGDFLDEEINIFSRGGATSFRMLAGAQEFEKIAFDFDLHQVTDIPEGYVNDDKPYKIGAYEGKMALALECPGSRDIIMAYVNTITDATTKDMALGAWESAVHWQIDDQFVVMFRALLGLTDERFYAMWQGAWDAKPIF